MRGMKAPDDTEIKSIFSGRDEIPDEIKARP